MNRKTFNRFTLIGILVSSVLTGCVAIPENEHPVQKLDASKLTLTSELSYRQANWPAADWWKLYGDDQLNQLIEQGRANSPTLATAASRIRQANATLSANQAEKLPTVSANASVTRDKETATGLIPVPYAGSYINQGRATLDFSYELDWWGKQSASIRAAAGQVAASRAEAASAELMLSTAITQQYFAFQSASAQLALVNQQIEKQDQLNRLQAARLKQGLETTDILRQQDQRRANLQQQAELLTTLKQQARIALRALTASDSLPALTAKPLPDVKTGVPDQLGVELIARRSEIDAARWRVESALSQEEVAKARFYPSFTINALVGFSTIELDKLFNSSSQISSIGPSIHLPIFDSGRLKANLEGNRAQTAVLINQYNESVINALKEVSDSVNNLQGVERQQAASLRAKQAAQAQQSLVEARLKQQLADKRQVIQAELGVMTENMTLLNLKQQQIAAQINLIKALGGGYQSANTNTAGEVK